MNVYIIIKHVKQLAVKYHLVFMQRKWR